MKRIDDLFLIELSYTEEVLINELLICAYMQGYKYSLVKYNFVR